MLRKVVFLFAFGLALGAVLDRSFQENNEDSKPNYRLPDDTRPLAYNLSLFPGYEKGTKKYTFTGQVEILIEVFRVTSEIVLNAVGLKFDDVLVFDTVTKRKMAILEYEMLVKSEQMKIYLNDDLMVGRQYQVRIKFSGLLRSDMTGLYTSTYTENKQKKWFAITQFKPTYARRAFPCYDEPRYRTPFNISWGRKEDQETLSNTPFIKTQKLRDRSEWWVDQYEPTPPIPTYLVAGLVGELKTPYQDKYEDVKVYMFVDYSLQTGNVMYETRVLTETMKNYTKSKSALKKFDFLAIPDLEPAAMENWGLNTFRERHVVINDDSKAKFKEESTMIVQRQISNQWFGNQVTCSWWDHVWLTEGFAQYFQYFATKMAKPHWRLDELFVIEQHQPALEFDQTPKHSVTASVKSPEEILEVFDRITYSKAAALLRMFNNTVGEPYFQEPLKIFLENNKNKAVNPNDLWKSFENYYSKNGYKLTEDVPFTKFVRSWTDQSGYPVIKVAKKAGLYEITQQKFSITPNKYDRTKWYVGLTFTNSVEKNFQVKVPSKWLKPSANAVYLRDSVNANWFILNLQSSGFYRVNYEESNWMALISQLIFSPKDIHVLNRAQLIDDSFQLARAGQLKYSTPLDLSKYLTKEDDFIPWYTAMNSFTYIIERMRRDVKGYRNIKLYVKNLAEFIYKKTEAMVLNNSINDQMTLKSWNSFSVWACGLGSVKCNENALKYFEKWQDEEEQISPDIKDAAFCAAVRKHNNLEMWNTILDVYKNTESQSEKYSAQMALTCTSDEDTLYEYLYMILNRVKSPIRLQDFKEVCKTMVSTPEGVKAMLNFISNCIRRIDWTVPNGEDILKYMFDLLASKVALDSEIKLLEELMGFASTFTTKYKKSFEKSFVQVETNLIWFENNHRAINKWIENELRYN